MARSFHKIKVCLFLVSCILCLALAGCGNEQVSYTVTVSPSSSTVGVNRSQRFFATIVDIYSNIVTKSISWSVAGGVGTIDASGVFYAGGSTGTGTVIASVEGFSGSATVVITDKGSIAGKIKDVQGAFLQNISVSCTSAVTLSAVTDSSGNYSISNVPCGTQEVIVLENVLYLSGSSDAYVITGETTTVNFTLLSRIAIENENISGDPISVSGRVRNLGTTEAKGVTVNYIFYDDAGTLLASSSQSVGDISSQTYKDFFMVPSPAISTYTTVTKTAAATSF